MKFSRGPVFARTLIEELGGPRDPEAIALSFIWKCRKSDLLDLMAHS